jgi:iron-sulfur cluster assembly protein
MIQVTDRAAKKVLQLAQRDAKAPILRIGVRGGGCTGLSYFWELTEQVRDNDEVLEKGELKVVCDPKSLQYIEGCEFDFETNLLKGGFKFRNPNAKQSCSCGESFAV